ncbi:DUF4249 family protein [Ekhidna sp.]|uniref:DUF4249 family protein n=1 Tax=Ekhidna sp. TaxID=2608089 RepID=UPI00329A4E19
MRKFLYPLIALIVLSCETQVDPELEASLNVLVIDAWLTNNDPTQHINITRSQPYFDNSTPAKVSGAIVTITDLTESTNPIYMFNEESDRYTWESGDGSTLGIIGHRYRLEVEVDGARYIAETQLNDSPPVDSVSFRLEKGNAFFDDLIFGEFFATDLEGINDTYWIKAWKNGGFLGEPGEINIAYDAAFSKDADNDGVQFIQPIRDGISSVEESRDEEFLSPFNLPDTLLFSGNNLIYKNDRSWYGQIRNSKIFFEVEDSIANNNVPDYLEFLPLNDDRYVPLGDTALYVKGDTVYVEIHSISNEAYFFLNQVIIETTRAGGFGALFATPLANVPTNIIPENQENSVAGFFNIAAVSGGGNRLREERQIRIVE